MKAVLLLPRGTEKALKLRVTDHSPSADGDSTGSHELADGSCLFQTITFHSEVKIAIMLDWVTVGVK